MVAKIGSVGIIITAMAVAVLGGAPFSVSEQDAPGIEYFGLAFAKDFELTYDLFSQKSSVLVGDKLVFTTHEKTSTNSITSETISVVDTKTGSLLYKIENPRKDIRSDWFGERFVIVGNNIASSSAFSDPDTQEQISLIHMFDGDTGELLYTIEDPIPENLHFGYTLESVGNYLAAYSSDDDPNDDNHGNVIYVFDANDGSLLHTIENPHTHRDFGKSLAAFEDNLLVVVTDFNNDESTKLIYSFDVKDGSLLYTIENPPLHGDFYGQVLITNDNLVIRSDDAMSVYDVNTGELLHTQDGFATTHSELQMILYSIGDDGYDNSFVILVVVIALGVIVLSIVLFKKMKK